MKNLNFKGFTFIEVLAVIAFVGVLALVAIPSIISVKDKINLRLYNTKKELILSAAELYAQDFNITSATTISVNKLLEEQYLEPDESSGKTHCLNTYLHGCALNPINNVVLNDTLVIINVQGKTYKASVNVWPE